MDRALIVCPLNVFFFSLADGSFVSLHRRTIVLILSLKQRPSRFLTLHWRTIVQMFRLDSKMDRALIICPLIVIFFLPCRWHGSWLCEEKDPL